MEGKINCYYLEKLRAVSIIEGRRDQWRETNICYLSAGRSGRTQCKTSGTVLKGNNVFVFFLCKKTLARSSRSLKTSHKLL